MATYDPKQVLTDYASGQITPEVAVGHSLQHIDKLYETVKASRSEWQAQTNALDKRVTGLQAAVDHLNALMEKVLRKPKRNTAGESPQA